MVHNSAYIASGETPQNCAASLTAYYSSIVVLKDYMHVHVIPCTVLHVSVPQLKVDSHGSLITMPYQINEYSLDNLKCLYTYIALISAWSNYN